MPLSRSVCFWCCLITLDLFWKKDLNWKSFGRLIWRGESPVREGRNVKTVAYLNCFSCFLFFFSCELRLFYLLSLLIDSNQLNITQRLSLYWKSMKRSMQDCKTLNAKVQVVAWLSTSTQLVSAFLELWMFVDVFMSLETLFLSGVCSDRMQSGIYKWQMQNDSTWVKKSCHIKCALFMSIKNLSVEMPKIFLKTRNIAKKLYARGRCKSWCTDN